MFSLEEFPEEPGSPPASPWGGSPPPSQPGTPTAEGRGRLGSEAGGGPGDPPGFRGRSRSAPPVLWAARRYGRQLRRMSDEFQLQVLPRPKSLGGAPPGREGGWRETLRAWWGARRPPRPAPPAPPP
ncbi:bcl2-associated agonist of cell death [Buteo buteo]|uniref:bcl2-associated agonist of cell death n=1 Tax=Buteo buteo TaxID=30397 RepID=UPI003EBDD1A6